ncbi:LacI family DNA-binding transcriptional regulator [Microbacterium sp. KUDC0406]|uniref:LacI family DNA-binding transcriptional regulator n=1 Tax=Microbacterium sp. KUDC0406 TaxID=2909588 RepID=UPI001F31331B|nr:LacI family DNA-binding transcriptional regulator [Microbacterium sp. KUDC0406]UJP09223.1 LacI family DNA-binding transcriptional regulator [Microbacterium sp. KUDC0406]
MASHSSHPRRGPSLEDVAREAGVSGQTVSRVVNGRGYVGAATREKVTAAMASLGYRPNSAARALRSGRFRTLGVIVFTLATYGNHRTLDAIAVRAAQAGYSLTLIPVDRTNQSTVRGAFSRLAEHAVDGIIILIEAHELDGSEIDIPAGMPIVVIDSNKRYEHPFVDIDQAQGARQITEHLLGLGHETVHHIAGPPESYAAERRREAWRSTLSAQGRAPADPQVGDWSARSGYEAGCVLRRDPAVTAVFAANDEMAIGAMRAFHEAGIALPGRVSVAGFDDVPDAAYVWPPLTTVRQPFEQVGQRAVDALLTELDGGDPVDQVLIGTELVIRGSTGAPGA